jgi:thiol-disulfide isomerase/thioredoxin
MKSVFIILCFLAFTVVRAQQKELTVGDTVPGELWTYLYTQNDPSLRPSALKGKLLVLDFWATTCHACFGTFKQVDSLQERFRDRVKWVMVTKESQEKVATVLSRLKKVKLPAVSGIYSDTVLSKWFFYVTIPHHVWIDSGGVVRAITPGYSTTAGNLEKELAGEDPHLYVKREVKGFEPPEPWTEMKGLVYFSYLSKRSKESRGGGMSIERDSVTKKVVGFNARGLSAANLFAIALTGRFVANEFLQQNRILVEGADREAYLPPTELSRFDFWADENLYNYHLRVPPERSADLYKIMQQELELLFGVKARIEKRKVKCLLLVRTGTPAFACKDCPKQSDYDEYDHLLTFRGYPMQSLATALSVYLAAALETPLLDATGYRGTIDVQLRVDKGDVKSVNEQLQHYGLALKEKYHRLDMVVISKKE